MMAAGVLTAKCGKFQQLVSWRHRAPQDSGISNQRFGDVGGRKEGFENQRQTRECSLCYQNRGVNPASQLVNQDHPLNNHPCASLIENYPEINGNLR